MKGHQKRIPAGGHRLGFISLNNYLTKYFLACISRDFNPIQQWEGLK